MILDVITAALIVIPMGIGMAKGFLYIILRFTGWIGSLAAGFFLTKPAAQILKSSPVGESVYQGLLEKFNDSADAMTQTLAGLPAILHGGIDAAAQTAAQEAAYALGDLIMTVLGFLCVTVLVRLLLSFLIRLTSKANHKGKISFPNKLAGLIVGGAEGLLLAFLFLAALIPVMHMTDPQTASSIADGLKFSYLAGSLYDGNLLMVMFSK